MPNTLAHIGINSLVTKSIIKRSEILWIYLGCLIPDFPWITRKFVEFIFPSINGYDLQTFVIVQATLIFSLLLSLTFALLSRNIGKTFLILLIGSTLHLLLDSLQTKKANGVHLFAPFNWEIINFGLFWPESIFTYLLTIFGLVYFILDWRKNKILKPEIILSTKRLIAFCFLLIIYFLLPVNFMTNVEIADNHFISTLRNYENRIGKDIEMDRKTIIFNDKTSSYWIESFDKSKIELSNIENNSHKKISIKGKFLTKDLIFVEELQGNWALFRNGTSYLGIILILIAWINFLKNTKMKFWQTIIKK